jgi:hypothetical protein
MAAKYGALIDPGAFPAKAASLETRTIRHSATTLRANGMVVHGQTTAIGSTWKGLSGCYEAPEQDKVLAVMDPAVTSADEFQTVINQMAGYLDTYAAALDTIKPDLADLEQRAKTFRTDVINGVEVDASSAKNASFGDQVKGIFDWVPGIDEQRIIVPWYEDAKTVHKNNTLLDEYAAILERITTASAQCANDIDRLVVWTCPIPAEAIPAQAFTSSLEPMPWGQPGIEDRNISESIGHGFYQFGKGTLEGLGQFISYNPQTAKWGDWDSAGQTRIGLDNLIVSARILNSVTLGITDKMEAEGKHNAYTDFMDDRIYVVGGAAAAMVNIDINATDPVYQWCQDAWAAGTEASLNVVSMIVPGTDAAKAFEAGSRVARVARFAGRVADTFPGGSWALSAGIRVVRSGAGVLRRAGETETLAAAGGTAEVLRIRPAPAVIDALTDPVDNGRS